MLRGHEVEKCRLEQVFADKGFLTRSILTEYCGAYSHTKLAKTPDIEVAYQVSPQQCLNILNTGVFTTPAGAFMYGSL